MTIGAVAALAVPSPAHADPLLDRLVAEAKTVGPDDFAWTRTSKQEQRSGSEVKARTIVERYDPSRPVGQRWTLVSIDGKAPPADDVRDHAKAMKDALVPNYGRVAAYFGAGAQRKPGAKPAYLAAKLPKGALLLGKSDLSASARAEVLVADGPRPFVERLDVVTTKPVRMMLVAKVDRMEATSRYKLMPDGRPVLAEQMSEMHGSMMGKEGSMRTVTTYSDHRAVSPR
ncbi:hypothetical protein ACFOMD_13625 [Sphingoaurantiacus capsulatus]|uniref:Uncharacterized protein n=1 Tax=Sphingoaurantiacus capsulatus TaxID=1771310 RepID=A0ABV7XDS6_9SPHN